MRLAASVLDYRTEAQSRKSCFLDLPGSTICAHCSGIAAMKSQQAITPFIRACGAGGVFQRDLRAVAMEPERAIAPTDRAVTVREKVPRLRNLEAHGTAMAVAADHVPNPADSVII